MIATTFYFIIMFVPLVRSMPGMDSGKMFLFYCIFLSSCNTNNSNEISTHQYSAIYLQIWMLTGRSMQCISYQTWKRKGSSRTEIFRLQTQVPLKKIFIICLITKFLKFVLPHQNIKSILDLLTRFEMHSRATSKWPTS